MNKLVIIGCDRSAGEALRSLQETGYCLPEGVIYQPLPCGGSLDVLHVLRALESGAERVLVLSCYADACRSFNGNTWAEKRTAAAQALLTEAGLGQERITYRQVSPNMSADLGAWIHTLINLEPVEAQDRA
ncbi:MAG: hydrogenase iron-sulfur subunit [Chloroflexi bacterium]|nr:hydrogenase iron-sulfur subunit [Chloroflexota bacterium]